jgi:hypothetical protein
VLSNWTSDREPLLAALARRAAHGVGTAISIAVKHCDTRSSGSAHPRAAMVLVSDGADMQAITTVIDLKAR